MELGDELVQVITMTGDESFWEIATTETFEARRQISFSEEGSGLETVKLVCREWFGEDGDIVLVEVLTRN